MRNSNFKLTHEHAIRHKTLKNTVIYLSALLCLSLSACSVLSIADAAVSGTVAVISTGVSATTSVVKAVLPSSKEAAK
jgi:hypothetical protein